MKEAFKDRGAGAEGPPPQGTGEGGAQKAGFLSVL